MSKTPKRISIGGSPLTLSEAKRLPTDKILYSRSLINSRGEAMRVRVTSVKAWKTRPDDVVVRVRHGTELSVRELGPEQLAHWSLEELPAAPQNMV